MSSGHPSRVGGTGSNKPVPVEAEPCDLDVDTVISQGAPFDLDSPSELIVADERNSTVADARAQLVEPVGAGPPQIGAGLGAPGKPKALSPADLTPIFRTDLELTRTTSGFVVRDPRTGQTFALNEFEGSLARMLDGRRSIAEIIKTSHQLEIPVNLESLQTFIDQLEDQGFLAPIATDAGQASAWPSRGRWETGVRSLFQSGIRLLRTGKHVEATGYFEALLEQDPENIEAQELLAMAKMTASPPTPLLPQAASVTEMTAVMTPPSAAPAVHVLAMTPIARAAAVLPMSIAPPPTVFPMASIAPPNAPSPMQRMLPMASLSPTEHVAPVAPMAHAGPIHAYPFARPGRFRRSVWIGAGALACVVIGSYLLSRGSGPTTEAVAQPAQHQTLAGTEPAMTEPAMTEPAMTEPAMTEPAPSKPEPEPSKPAPAKLEPAKPEPAKPEPARFEPAKPEPAPSKPAPVKPMVKTVEPILVKSSLGGEIGRAFLDRARTVDKGEKLFEVVYVTGNEKARELNAKIARLEKIASQDQGGFVPASVIEATNELSRARKELKNAVKIQRVIVTATHAGHAEPRVVLGAAIKAGTVLAKITP